MTPRALFIVNPRSRRGKEHSQDVRRRLVELGLDLVTGEAGSKQDPSDLIQRYRGEIDRVVVAGGDGSLNSVLQGMVGTGLPLAIIPLGTANNLARTLDIPLALPEACEVAVRGARRRIDLGQVNDRYFLTTASLGLSVKITEALTSKTKRRWGPLAYGVASVRALTRSRAFHADISWPGGRRHSRTVQIVVGNGRYYGSALAVAADATIDDARLDLYSLEVRHWVEILTLVPSLRSGRHGRKDRVEALRATEFEITTVVPREINVDGEICEATPARFRVVPGALEVFAPVSGSK
ncbi:MAG TPA: lipid kinase [Gemmatimonadales bacterium]|nr:lipid kinase [Gemmatimonadales bacterium]